MTSVSVVIPTMKGREDLLQKLLASIPDIYEKIIVDDEDLLLAAKRNKGARFAKGEYLFFVDDDNYLEDGAIENLVESFEAQNGVVAVIGMMACYQDKPMMVADGGSLRNYLTGFTFGLNTNCKKLTVQRYGRYRVDEVANAFMIRREVFEAVGGFDEVNFPMDMNESDICKRIKDMGYLIVMNPKAVCYHKSVTYNAFPTFRRALYAYHHGRGRILYSRKFNHGLRYCLHISIFLPLFFCFYTTSLLARRNFKVIIPFWRGIFDGLRNHKTNKYQSR